MKIFEVVICGDSYGYFKSEQRAIDRTKQILRDKIFVMDCEDDAKLYEDGEYDDVEDFDKYGHAYLSNDSIAARITTLYSPIVKSFRLAKQADENINFEKNILWRA